MMDIKIFDKSFSHASSFGNGDLEIRSKNFNWYRGIETRDICFFTDFCLKKIVDFNIHRSRLNVAWLLEPPSIAQQNYEWIIENYIFFEYVLTYKKSLLAIDKRFKWVPHGGCWIYPKDFFLYNKSNYVSIIVSNKRETEGHCLRHEVVNDCSSKIDYICGKGYSPFHYKLSALKDFRFSIVIENGRFDTYFSEKLIDCFVTGTIPIYWGSSLKGIFDENGILYFNDVEELDSILSKIKEGSIKYENMLESVKFNFEQAKQYTITEDWIYDNFIKGLYDKVDNL